MAENTPEDRLRELALRAAASRQGLRQATLDIGEAGNVNRRVSTSIRNHVTTWMGSAALLGWILSRLPARKKTIYLSPGKSKGKESVADHVAGKAQKSGILVALAGLIFQAVRPALQKYVMEFVQGQMQRPAGSRAASSPRKSASPISEAVQ